MLVLVRHGQSLYNKAGMFTGIVDSKLSTVGVEQAETTGLLLRKNGLRFDVAYSSHLSRAFDTAQLILEQTFSVCEIIEDKRLAERDYGEWSGKEKKFLFLEHGEKMFKLYRRSYNTAPPGAESLHDVVERVKRWLPQLKNHTGKNVLVVSHGNTMRALSVAFGFHDEKTVEGYEIETGQPILLEWTNLKKRF